MSRAIHKMRVAIPITPVLGTIVTSASNLTVYTIAQTWAAVGPGRVVVAMIDSNRNNSPRSVSSVTIGGIAATILAQDTSTVSGDTNVSCIAAAFVPTGTSGDVVVTMNFQMNNLTVSIVTLYNVRSITTTFNGVDNSSGSSLSVTSATVQLGGIIMGMASRSATATLAWTNLTERRDDEVLAQSRHGVAYDVAADFSGPATITVTSGSGTRFVMAVASIR